jgi:guanosine-3',5'-bis(diphosphate) 3'-pyrophosphohydrolase
MELTTKDLERAIIFATEKHKGQIRKGNGRPYILHPLSVMQHLYNYKKSKNINILAMATVLHDCLEDTDTTIEEIAELFGYHVASIVIELTSDNDKIKEQGKAPYLLAKMLGMSSYALVIKLCDRLDNINDMVDMNENFRIKYIKETNFILNGLLDNNGRFLSKTHLRLIKEIRKSIKQY